MSEPTLEEIEDYNELKGSKKKVVWGVIIVCLIVGAMYVTAYKVYDNKGDKIDVEKSIKSIPVK